ncbi:Preli Domain-Containing Protein 2 [Manis pentadactyla]|nr:Preli Domain-Containing Protein 2 [Manis pentadactyla]
MVTLRDYESSAQKGVKDSNKFPESLRKNLKTFCYKKLSIGRFPNLDTPESISKPPKPGCKSQEYTYV